MTEPSGALAVAVNQRVRSAPAHGGGVVVLGVWCSTCREEVGPLRDGTCPMCNSFVYDEDSLTAREAIAAPRTQRSGTVVGGTLVDQVKELLPLAKALERARARIEGLPSSAEAKASFDEAARRASASPSPENLKRVTDAAKVLQKGSPRRTSLEVALADAELAFSRAFEAIDSEPNA